ncbi:Uncharacterised protein [Rhodococcus coprophilus]|uniref:Uncharacterized protein n=1 Tax=Rhodococcus coprophilus TaxID=38310 RepID=A0A2X4ULW3_9NOCA|nr:Uncharacterised protein [Rhodococcus coprophilus]
MGIGKGVFANHGLDFRLVDVQPAGAVPGTPGVFSGRAFVGDALSARAFESLYADRGAVGECKEFLHVL